MFYELAKRSYDGILVRLLWDSLSDRVVVRYRDGKNGDAFAAEVPKDQALTAFRHPNIYRRPNSPRLSRLPMNALLSSFVAIDLLALGATITYVLSRIFGVGFRHHSVLSRSPYPDSGRARMPGQAERRKLTP